MKEITTDELLQKVESGEQLHIIDVREDDEVAAGIIEVAKHIKMGEISEHLDELNKTEQYFFVCRGGTRSGKVCAYLEEQGYDVVNVVGGMSEWKGEMVTK